MNDEATFRKECEGALIGALDAILKPRGFRRKRTLYAFATDEAVATLWVQRTRDAVSGYKFCLNLGTYSLPFGAWRKAAHGGEVEPGTAGAEHLRWRLGSETTGDRWWWIRDQHEVQSAIAEIAGLLQGSALDDLCSLSTTAGILKDLDRGCRGQSEAGRARMIAALRGAPPPIPPLPFPVAIEPLKRRFASAAEVKKHLAGAGVGDKVSVRSDRSAGDLVFRVSPRLGQRYAVVPAHSDAEANQHLGTEPAPSSVPNLAALMAGLGGIALVRISEPQATAPANSRAFPSALLAARHRYRSSDGDHTARRLQAIADALVGTNASLSL